MIKLVQGLEAINLYDMTVSGKTGNILQSSSHIL